MPNASGVFKRVAYKKESTFGTLAGASGAQSLRRISCDLSLNKDTYGSNEVRSDLQKNDFRHGVKRGAGKLSSDLSPKTVADFFGSFCKRPFAAGVSATAVSLTIAGSGPYTVTRAAGSYLTDGFKVGDVIRLSVGSLNVNNISKNLLITGLTATVATVVTLNGSAMTAEGPVTGCTVAVAGKKTWIPTSGFVEESYTIEQFYDTPASEAFTGVKINGFGVNLSATGIATVDFDLLAKDMTPNTVQYFTSPTAPTTTGSLAAVNGLMHAGGAAVAVLTGLTINGAANYSGDPVVGSNTVPQFYPGMVEVSGQATAYFDSVTLRDAFLNETEIDLMGVFTSDNTATADFMSFVMSRVKLLSHTKSDGAGAITVTMQFQALLNSAGGTGLATEKTTLSIQDSAA